ncbi:DUF1259 domain-containing protein [Mesorhizobium sp. BAC0120]|uniref:DUF1259 domain-containing protein n=1 Tax=Mesorhizobium sp. BAC0120 TaxID=3090670 RepID=UPI00298C250B|nr:DUF1259 domain-containing protein [Mesorhizobium sp. BAC0120]MDW6020771.1 DUF1259 domain-containing protein [Mesorhizobium sp. BAC0120]
MHAKSVAGLAFAAALGVAQPVLAAPDWKAVAQALGKSGTAMPDGVYRVGLPRSDLKVTVDGIEIKPAFALGGWLAFQAAGDKDAMVMGDLVLTENEINPVMESLAGSGIETTGLHNHLLRADPATMYMHVEGHGDAVKLADSLHAALALSKTPFGSSPSAKSETVDLDTAGIDGIMGSKGKVNGGVYQFTIPRADKITESGMPVPASMGTGIAINFEPLGGGKAAITGDFVLTSEEVNPVLRQLREHGIEVTALHNHMLAEQPRLFFMHFWSHDDAATLARGLRSALDKTNLQRS